MARFVSHFRDFSHGVRPEVESFLGRDGKMVPGSPMLEAVFRRQWATDADLHEGRSRLQYPGIMELENGEPFGYGLRTSVFDSEMAQLQNGWSDEDTELVVNTLRASGHNGMDFVEIEKQATARPWNGYDALTDPEKILELAIATEADLAQVLAYERENQNRPDVITTLTGTLAMIDDTVVVQA